MREVTLLGLDIAKNVFQLHGVNKVGKAVLKKRLSRGDLKEFIVNLPACLIVMEACGGAHYWAREFQGMGHKVKLISPQFVKPFVKTNKNDAKDAEAITEAASRPGMRFVPIKGEAQQDIQCIHRVRERLITQRTCLVNQIRGFLAEYGVVVAQGVSKLKKRLPEILSDTNNKLTAQTRVEMNFLYDELFELEKRIKIYEGKIERIFKSNDKCQKLAKINGIGPLTATALLLVLSDPSVYKNGRHFASFLGLVPKQHSSGGKERLLGISKRGNIYLRNLLIHGGRAALRFVDKHTDKRSRWASDLKERRGYNRASVAVANKNARTAWALLAKGTAYDPAHEASI